MNQNFCRHQRLIKASEFSRVFEESTFRQPSQYFLLLGSISKKPFNRLGMVVAKKHVARAADRNKVKRAMREVFRKHEQSANSDCMDIVLLVRKKIPKPMRLQLSIILNEQLCKLLEKTCKTDRRSFNANASS